MPMTCGGARIFGAIALGLEDRDGISLTLVQSAEGYCFSDWSHADQRAMPVVSEEDRVRAFDTVADASAFFGALYVKLGGSSPNR